jgi:hypothetical protein
MIPSSPIKEADVPSVALNLRQEHGGWRGTITIGQESFEDCLISSVTASSWVVDEKMQIYIAVRPFTLTAPQPLSGESSTMKSPNTPNSIRGGNHEETVS